MTIQNDNIDKADDKNDNDNDNMSDKLSKLDDIFICLTCRATYFRSSPNDSGIMSERTYECKQCNRQYTEEEFKKARVTFKRR